MFTTHSARLQAVREGMARHGLEALLLSVGADLFYFSGYTAMPTERLTMLVVLLEGEATLVVPELEAPRVPDGPFVLRSWHETEDPGRIAADLVGSSRRVAVGDQLWALFLLRLQELLAAAEFVSATPIISPLRIRKEPDEIELLRAAGRAADRVVTRITGERFSGRTERQLAGLVADLTLEEGHEASGFAIVAAGPNGASPHHEPADRMIAPGDLVVVDFGGKVGGYGSDCTRTFSVGPSTPEQSEVHAVVVAAHQAAISEVQPGVAAQHVDCIARSIIEEAGYGQYFIHRTGHGIGLDGHEPPYLVEGNHQALEQGMCFSIEPGIYLPGRFGVRIEDIVTVTGDGCESFNQADRSLLVVE